MSQERYQVRFEWGATGARRVAAGAHVVVVADELDGHGQANAAALAAGVAMALGDGPAVLCVTEASAASAARWILRLQERLGERTVVAVIGAGSHDDDGYRFAVEDQFVAGAVVDALADLGLDFSSPEAAAACASFTTLRRATGHLLTASASATASSSSASASSSALGAGRGVPGVQDPAAQRAAHPASVTVLREFDGGEFRPPA